MKGKFKKIVISIFLLGGIFKGGTINANELKYVQPFQLNPINDGIQLGLGLSLSGSALLCDKVFHIKKPQYNPEDWNINNIPVFDRWLMRPYNHTLNIVGTGTVALSVIAPAIFAIMPPKEWLTVGTMYAETMLIAYGIKDWIKLLVYRARPYMYFDGYPQKKLENGDWCYSFPSAHTTFAFAGAAFTTFVFSQCYPDSNWKYLVGGLSFGIAALTGCLRIASGNHFLSDVLMGAVIGTTCGIVVPLLHMSSFYNCFQKDAGAARATVSPVGFNISISF